MARTVVVPAVRCLFTQANALAPDRVKTSDGTVGDRAHAARASDHNPDECGRVFAGDLTDDDGHGIDCRLIAAAIVTARDRRVKYLIHEGRMIRSYPVTRRNGEHIPAWTWTAYTGSNAHTRHLHVSVLADKGDDTRPWPGLSPHAAVPAPVEDPDMAKLFTVDGKTVFSATAHAVEHVPSPSALATLRKRGLLPKTAPEKITAAELDEIRAATTGKAL